MPVVKIGGSIQKDERDFSLIVEKIRSYAKGKTIVVTSALKGVTNQLISATENRDKAVDIVSDIYDKHVKLLSKVAEGPAFEQAFREISKLADELFKIAWSIRVLDEMTPRVRDYILSFGERMATIVLNASLNSSRVESTAYPEPPLVTDDNFGDAKVIEKLSALEVKKILDLNANVVVVPGFIGKTENNRYTTLGRGGSDYTATVLGKLTGIEEVRLITEVPGIMTGDPKKFPNAVTIKRLSLEEAIELSQMGAKRLHPRTFEPLLNSNVQVIIEGLYDEGYTVVQGKCSNDKGIKGIAVVDELKLVTVESTDIVGKVGSAAKVMKEAKDSGVNIVSISQPASETTIQLVVNSNYAELLSKRLTELPEVERVELEDVDAVNVVGCGLKFKEVYKEVLREASNYNVISVSRGLNNVSVTFIVKKDDSLNLAKDLHEVVLKWTR
ncbi:MAG: aspartate kinase [Candidatus Aramenus sp.]|nr:aspartate kinase [Candidatus Aramenus sp.]